MINRNLPYVFVTIQFACIVVLAATGPLVAGTDWGIMLEFAGIFLGVLAIYQMKVGNFNVIPVPKTEGIMVTHGIYKYLRHPMYLAQLMVFAPLISEHYSHFRLTVWIVLLMNLVFKLHFEERLLKAHFEGYADYMKTTWRLVPFVY
jgi:protein-S-isoprenylcysteine O-methyltransferase Ste14